MIQPIILRPWFGITIGLRFEPTALRSAVRSQPGGGPAPFLLHHRNVCLRVKLNLLDLIMVLYSVCLLREVFLRVFPSPQRPESSLDLT